jgi:hypothetical protein
MSTETKAEPEITKWKIPDEAPKPYPGEEIMHPSDAASSRKRGLKNRRCRICRIISGGVYWWESTTHVAHGCKRDSSPHVKVSYALGTSYSHYDILYVVMDEDEFKKNAPMPRRSTITNIVSTKTIEMIKANPNNDTFRATLMREIGESPPKDADTYDKLVDWVECNFPRVTPTTAPPDYIAVHATSTFQESGRCNYERDMRWSGSVKISAGSLMQMAARASSWAIFIREFHDFLKQTARDFNHTQVGITPSNYDVEDSQNERVMYNETMTARDALEVIQKTCSVKVLEKFGLRPHPDNPYSIQPVPTAQPAGEEEELPFDPDDTREAG